MDRVTIDYSLTNFFTIGAYLLALGAGILVIMFFVKKMPDKDQK